MRPDCDGRRGRTATRSRTRGPRPSRRRDERDVTVTSPLASASALALALASASALASRSPVRSRGGARQAEVEHAHAAVVADDHVVGLEVAVHQAGAVRRRQPFARGEEHVEDLAAACRGSAFSQLRSVWPSTNSMAMNTSIAEGADVVDRDHVGVRQPRQRLRLAQEPIARLRGRRRSIALAVRCSSLSATGRSSSGS